MGGQVVFGGTSNAGGGGGGGGALTPPVSISDTAPNVDLILQNTTTATNATTNGSPILDLQAQYWTGAASAADDWKIGSSLAAGTNGASTLNITHSGSSGTAAISVPRIVAAVNADAFITSNSGNATIGFANNATISIDFASSAAFRFTSGSLNAGVAVVAWGNAGGNTVDAGISRLGAASLALGNGTAGDFTGALKLTTLTLQGKVGTYNGVATVGAGVPSLVAAIDLTAQAAAIAAGTALYAVPAAGAGLYRVSVYAKITTAGTTSILGGTSGFQLTWTDPTDSTTPTAITFGDSSSQALNGNTTTTVYVTSAVVACKASTNLQYGFDYTSTGTAMQFKLSLKLEFLG